jgi:CheY-like chemotaxis protein
MRWKAIAELFWANSGADGYIAKPVVDHEYFVSEVKKAISETGE